MSLPSAPQETTPAGRPGLSTWLGYCALWLVVYVSLLKLPAPVSSGLDPSWRMVIGHAVGRGFQWGVDLVFTYGPLGYLLASTNHGEHYNHFLLWQGISNVLFATVILMFGRRFRGWQVVVFYAYFLAFVANYLDAMHITMVVLLLLTALREPSGGRRWLVVLVGALLAVLALVKFTNLMLAGFGVTCITLHHAWRRRWPDLAVVAGSFSLFFLIGWLLCGQNPANLPAYVFTSLNASGGYGEGMSFYETPVIFALGLTSALAIAAYYLLTLWRRKDFPLALGAMLIAAAASFMNWKHGFIRADGHVFAHFISCLLVCVTFPVLLADDGPLRRLKVGLLALAATAGLTGTLLATPTAITDAPAIWNYNLKAIGNGLRILPDLNRNAIAEFSTVARPHFMPAVRSIVGEDPIDMIGNEQAYLLFNRFNYRPRPVFQSYLPYTGRLLQLNEEFLRSPRAPEFILQKMDTIDFRLPALEDSLATRYLYYHYRFVLEEKGMLLWRRAAPDPALDEKKPIESRRVDFGESVPVPDQGENAIWTEIVIRPSLLGRLRAFLYKAPILTMAVTDAGGFKNNYRIIREMAGEGFLFYPHFTSGYNVQRYMSGDPAPRASTFSLDLPPAQRKYFRPDIEVRFHELPPLPRNPGLIASEPEAKFRMFDRVPVAVSALYPVTNLETEGREALFAHPPSTLEFQVDFPATRVRGKFGLASNSYVAPNYTDGAEFIVEWIEAGGKSTLLFARNLRPGQVVGDRGFQGFDVGLPSGGGRLVLRITPGPSGDIACDWAFWTEVRFTP